MKNDIIKEREKWDLNRQGDNILCHSCKFELCKEESKLKSKLLFILLLSTSILISSGCSVDEGKISEDEVKVSEDEVSSEYTQKMQIMSGTLIEGTQFRDYYYADKRNGKYTKLKVKNNGNTDVHLSINDKSKITVAPGEEDTTQLEVTDETEKYEHWVRTDSGRVSIEYKVFQEN